MQVLAKFVVYAHTLLPSSATQQQRDQKMSEARAMKERLLTVVGAHGKVGWGVDDWR